MEKAMAPHSSTLAQKIPWIEEPGRQQSMGSQRVGHDWVISLSLFTFMHWRRKWQPTPVFLPGESQGQGNLVGRRLWGHTELDTTQVTQQQQQQGGQRSFELERRHCTAFTHPNTQTKSTNSVSMCLLSSHGLTNLLLPKHCERGHYYYSYYIKEGGDKN